MREKGQSLVNDRMFGSPGFPSHHKFRGSVTSRVLAVTLRARENIQPLTKHITSVMTIDREITSVTPRAEGIFHVGSTLGQYSLTVIIYESLHRVRVGVKHAIPGQQARSSVGTGRAVTLNV